MNRTERFGHPRDLSITILVDNRADLMVESTETIKYFTDEPLLAEHGFAALFDLKAARIRILWDAGITDIALMENMKRMDIDPASIDEIAISHGHRDHTASGFEVLAAMDLPPDYREWPADTPVGQMVAHAQGRRLPIIAHPAAFHERWWFDDDGKIHGPRRGPPRAEWEAAWAETITSVDPYELGPGCWTTGYVPRRSLEKAGRPTNTYYRQDREFLRDDLDEDQAISCTSSTKGWSCSLVAPTPES